MSEPLPALSPRDITAKNILHTAEMLLKDRGEKYDSAQERSIPAVVTAFNALAGHALTAEQGWLFLTLVKIARAQNGYKADNYDDGAAYMALMGEQAAKDSPLT